MMRISYLEIDGLFNAYNYRIKFNEESRITLITGPNGYGKTTILNIIYSLSRNDLLFFLKLVFNNLLIEFENGEKLRINRVRMLSGDDGGGIADIIVSFRVFNSENKEVSRLDISRKDVEWVIKRNTKGIFVDDGTLYVNNNDDGVILSDNTAIVKALAKKNNNEQFLLYLSELKCRFITDDRINAGIDDNKDQIESIELVARSFRKLINDEREKYYANAQRINETMVSRLLDDTIEPLDKEKYEQISDYVRTQIRLLKRFNIIDEVNIRPYNAKMDKVLTMDLLAARDKIIICSETLTKLQMFSELLTKKHLANKYIIFDRRAGFILKDAATGDNISLKNLSSGEKNEIVILYNTIFETGNRSILLIDEPENSLHVAWQVDFLDDIEAIAGTNDLQVIIATHSPNIIGERWNMTFDLYERNEKA